MLGSVIRGPVGIFPLPPDRALAPTLPGLSGSGLYHASRPRLYFFPFARLFALRPQRHCRSQLGCRSRRWPCRGGPSRSGGSSCGVRRVGPVAVAWASSTPELLPESTFSDPWVNSHEESRGGYTPPPANLVRNPSGCDP